MDKPAYFILGLKLVPSPERDLQKVITEIDKKISVWCRSQDLDQKAQAAEFQQLKSKLRGPNGRNEWDAEIKRAQQYAEGRLNDLLKMFQTSKLMTGAQFERLQTHRKFLDFYTPEEIEQRILDQGISIQGREGQPLPVPTSPRPARNPNAKRPLAVHAQLIEKNLKLLNRADLYELLADPIAPQSPLAMMARDLGKDDLAKVRKASCAALRQRASAIEQKLSGFRTKFAQNPAYNALNQLCGLCTVIFADDAAKAGYDLDCWERPLRELKPRLDFLAMNPVLPRAQYNDCIELVKKLNFPANEAEWYVYEFFLSKGTRLEPESGPEAALRMRKEEAKQQYEETKRRCYGQRMQVDREFAFAESEFQKAQKIFEKAEQDYQAAKQKHDTVVLNLDKELAAAKQKYEDIEREFNERQLAQAKRAFEEAEKRFNRSGGSSTPSQRKAGDRMVKTVDGIEYAFRWCPAGTFLMGSPEDEEGRYDDETQHEVTLSKGFWMLETQVTQAMWQSVMGSNPSMFKGDDLPVERVIWNDCQEFCRKLSSKIGMKITLPTEAQWEYACRAGTTGPYAGNSLDEMGWYWCSNPHPVGQKKPNAWGLYDMHGNVGEWCQDWYGDYPSGAVTDPTGPNGGSLRVGRSGNWSNRAQYCRSSCRGGDYADDRSRCLLGFRVVGSSK